VGLIWWTILVTALYGALNNDSDLDNWRGFGQISSDSLLFLPCTFCNNIPITSNMHFNSRMVKLAVLTVGSAPRYMHQLLQAE
jgi:hypothetical protein